MVSPIDIVVKTGIIRNRKVTDGLLALFLSVSFVIFIPPMHFWDMEWFTKYDSYLRFGIVGLLIFGWVIELGTKKRIDELQACFLLFSGCLAVATILNNADLKSALWSDSIIPFAIIVLIYFSVRISSSVTSGVLYVLYFLFLLANAYTLSIFDTYYVAEEGTALLGTYLFGNRNGHVYYYLIALFSGYFFVKEKNALHWIGYGIVYGVCLYSCLKAGSLTAMAVIALWGAGILYTELRGRLPFGWTRFNMLFTTILFIVLQLYSLSENSSLFSWLKVFGKRATISGRTPIWNETWKRIPEAWLFGHGDTDLHAVIDIVHPHSVYLHILYNRGLLGMAVFIVLLLILHRQAEKIMDIKIRSAVFLMLFCVLLMIQFDEMSISFYALYGALVYYFSLRWSMGWKV